MYSKMIPGSAGVERETRKVKEATKGVFLSRLSLRTAGPQSIRDTLKICVELISNISHWVTENWSIFLPCLEPNCLRVALSTRVLTHFSRVRLCATLWTVAHQPPLSMGFSRPEYWSGLPWPPSGIFLTQGSNLCLLSLLCWQAGSLPLVPLGNWIKSDSAFILLKF